MNFILNHRYSDGNTPIRPEEVEQLIPKISTMKELNEYEALNILAAQTWAFSNRTMNSTDPFEESYVRTLHAKMFDQVWKWAGTYRKRELNIGCDPREITQRIPQLLGNTK
jgi:fido (protein-threonine AMPylation protein)